MNHSLAVTRVRSNALDGQLHSPAGIMNQPEFEVFIDQDRLHYWSQVLNEYDHQFRSIRSNPYNTVSNLIDGSPASIEAARWLFYEGIDAHFRPGLLDEAIPLIVLESLLLKTKGRKVLVRRDNGWEPAIYLLSPPRLISVSQLCSGEFVTGWPDRGEYVSRAEFALASIESHIGRFA